MEFMSMKNSAVRSNSGQLNNQKYYKSEISTNFLITPHYKNQLQSVGLETAIVFHIGKFAGSHFVSIDNFLVVSAKRRAVGPNHTKKTQVS
jgi:hypothetical protein